MVDVARKVADAVDIPFAVGGGISSITAIREILDAGTDKVGINTAAVKNPDFVRDSSREFGRERITVAVDARRNSEIKPGVNVFEIEDGSKAWFELVIYGGRTPMGIDAIDWCRKMEGFGAGEILPTSMDRDGTNIGYDLPLTKAICEAVDIPVIASGGASTPQHILEAFTVAHADAALAAGMFHRGEYTVGQVKQYLKEDGIQGEMIILHPKGRRQAGLPQGSGSEKMRRTAMKQLDAAVVDAMNTVIYHPPRTGAA